MNTGTLWALGAAWRRAEDACASLVRETTPMATEPQVMRVVLASWLGRTALRVVTVLGVAWQSSMVRRVTLEARDGLATLNRAERLRLGCVIVGVAAAVHLALIALTPRWQTPLVWLLPAAVLLGAFVAGTGARPLVRAWRERGT